MYRVIKASSEPSDYLQDLYDQYVPSTGKCDTLLGEILRAFAQIRYRYYNDGDQIGEDYGRETCNPAARFLAAKIPSLKDLEAAAHDPYEIGNYKSLLNEIEWKVEDYIMENEQDLASKKNSEDMWNYRTDEDVSDYWDEDEEDDW